MYQYHFITRWQFNAPLTRVWEEIKAMDDWPEWWKYVKSVEILQEGDDDEIGSVRRVVWKTALPYHLTFNSELISLERHKRMEGRTFGELEGKGIWTFASNNGITDVRYEWMANINKKWLQWLEPLARPLFTWNHNQVMKGGYEGLKKRLREGHRA